MSSIGKLMKQAQRMQAQMEQVQASLSQRTVEATSGGGAVKVIAKCDGTIASIKIDPQALNPSDAQLVEDMVLTAANQALTQAKQISDAIRKQETEQESAPLVLGLSPLWNPDRSDNNPPFDGFSSAEPTSLVNAAAKLLEARAELPESDVSRI